MANSTASSSSFPDSSITAALASTLKTASITTLTRSTIPQTPIYFTSMPSLTPSVVTRPSSVLPTTLPSATPTTPVLPQLVVVFPAAGILAIVIVIFIFVVVAFYFVRKCFMMRGLSLPCTCASPCPALCPVERSCWECCRGVCEKLDCKTPECAVCIDRVCPSKQSCRLWCDQVMACYCWQMCSNPCKDMNLCPDFSALECPDCDCHCCHCAIKPPECTQISCLCFECGRPPVAP